MYDIIRNPYVHIIDSKYAMQYSMALCLEVRQLDSLIYCRTTYVN